MALPKSDRNPQIDPETGMPSSPTDQSPDIGQADTATVQQMAGTTWDRTNAALSGSPNFDQMQAAATELNKRQQNDWNAKRMTDPSYGGDRSTDARENARLNAPVARTMTQNEQQQEAQWQADMRERNMMANMTPAERAAYNEQQDAKAREAAAQSDRQTAYNARLNADERRMAATDQQGPSAVLATGPNDQQAQQTPSATAGRTAVTAAAMGAAQAPGATAAPQAAPSETKYPGETPQQRSFRLQWEADMKRSEYDKQQRSAALAGRTAYKAAYDDARAAGMNDLQAKNAAAKAAKEANQNALKYGAGSIYAAPKEAPNAPGKVIGTPDGSRVMGTKGNAMPYEQDPITGDILPSSAELSQQEFLSNITDDQKRSIVNTMIDSGTAVGQQLQKMEDTRGQIMTDPKLTPREQQMAIARLDQQEGSLIYGAARDYSPVMRQRATERRQFEQQASAAGRQGEVDMRRQAAEQQRMNQQIWQNSVKRARAELSADPYNAPSESQINARAMKLYAEAGGGMQTQSSASMGAVRGTQMPQAAPQPVQGAFGAQPSEAPVDASAAVPVQSGAPDSGRLAIGETTPLSFQTGPQGTILAVDPDSGRVFAGANIHGRAVAIANDAVEEQMLPPGTDYILRGNPTKILTKGGFEGVGGGSAQSAREVQINPQQADYEIGQAVTKTVAERTKAWNAYKGEKAQYDKVVNDSTRAAAEKLGLQVAADGKPVYSTDLNEAADQKTKMAIEVQKQTLAKAQELYNGKEKQPSWVMTDASGNVTQVNAPQMSEQFAAAKQEFDAAEEQRRNQARAVGVQGATKIEKQVADIASKVFLPNKGNQDKQLAWNLQTETKQEERDRVLRGIAERKRLLEVAGGASKAAGSQYGRVLMSQGSAGDAALQLLNIALDPTITGGGMLDVPTDKTSNEGVEWVNNMSALMAAAEKTPGARDAIIAALGSKVTGGQVSAARIPTDSESFRAARTAVLNAAVTNPDLAVAWHRMVKNYATAPLLRGSNAAEENTSVMRLMNTARKSHAAYAEGQFTPGEFNSSVATEKDRAAAEAAFYQSKGTSKEQLQQQDIAKSARGYGASTYIDRATGKTMIDVRGIPMQAANVRVGNQSVRMPIPSTAQQAMHMITSGMPYAQIGPNGTMASKVGMDNPLLKQIAENTDKNLQTTTGRTGANPGVQAATRFVSENFGYLPQKEQRMLFETILRRNGYAERQ